MWWKLPTKCTLDIANVTSLCQDGWEVDLAHDARLLAGRVALLLHESAVTAGTVTGLELILLRDVSRARLRKGRDVLLLVLPQ